MPDSPGGGRLVVAGAPLDLGEPQPARHSATALVAQVVDDLDPVDVREGERLAHQR
jgi:hypothetical protein